MVVLVLAFWALMLALPADWLDWPTWRMNRLFLGIVGGVVLLIVLAFVLRAVEARGRRGEMRGLAGRLGFTYARADGELGRWARRVPSPVRALGGVARNVLSGDLDGHRVRVFDFRPIGPALGREKHPDEEELQYTVLALDLGVELPRLEIALDLVPRGLSVDLDRARLEFDSIEFSRTYRVRCADREFAHAVCHPRMMDYLLFRRELFLLIDGDRLAITLGRGLRVEEIPGRLQELVEIRNLLPRYLFEER